MAYSYTHKYSQYPNVRYSAINFLDLKDAPDSVVNIVNQIRTFLEQGEYSQASGILEENKTTLKRYMANAEYVNTLSEEIRNIEIQSKENKTGLYYSDLVPDAMSGDVWIGGY